MKLLVPPDLEARLARVAAGSGRTADEVALEMLTASIEHDEWFRSEIEKGRLSAREGRLISEEDLASRIHRRYRG